MDNVYMDFDEFAQTLVEELRDILPDDGSCEVTLMKVGRNNQVQSETLTVRGDGHTCAPVIHLSEIYEFYLKGVHISTLAQQIAEIYVESADKFSDLVSDEIFDYDIVRDRIILKLINYDKNEELLKEVPHIRQLDLAITFRMFSGKDDEMTGTILVTDNLIRMWHVTPEALFETAAANMNRLWKPQIVPLNSLAIRSEPGDAASSLMIMSNEKYCFGAASLFCSDQLKALAKLTDIDYFVLPSSIHELILVPCDGEAEAPELAEMVKKINAEVVADQDFLSNNVYLYDRKADKLTIVG